MPSPRAGSRCRTPRIRPLGIVGLPLATVLSLGLVGPALAVPLAGPPVPDPQDIRDALADPDNARGNRSAIEHPLPPKVLDWSKVTGTKVDRPGRDRAGSTRTTQEGATLSAATVDSTGSWSVVGEIPKMIHAWTMPGGSIIACNGSSNERATHNQQAGEHPCLEIDPTTLAYSTLVTPHDLFCGGAAHDEQGRVVTVGGTAYYPAENPAGDHWAGTRTAYRFSGDGFTRLGDMAQARWYPNALRIQSGSIDVIGGRHNGVYTDTIERLPVGSTAFSTRTAKFEGRYYPDVKLVGPNLGGYSGATGGDPAPAGPGVIDLSDGTFRATPGLRSTGMRNSAAGILAFPAQDKQVFVFGGGNKDGDPAIPLLDRISYAAASPTFTSRGDMPVAAMNVLADVLPNGQIFVTGGLAKWRSGSHLWAAYYDPARDTWTPAATPTVPRNYHSVMVTDTDGTSLVFGGNPVGSHENRVERMRHWYTQVPRPVLSATPAAMAYGSAHPVTVRDIPAGQKVGYFTLSALEADTHNSDPNHRVLQLPFRQTATGGYEVHLPEDTAENRAAFVPGMYRMAVVTVPTDVPDGTVPDNTVAKVPSVTVDVRIGAAGTTPATRTVTLDAIEDTRVSQNAASTNYGGSTLLQSDSHDVSTDSTSRITSYLKYRIPGLAAGESITAASLGIDVTNGTANGPTVHRTAADWSEGTLTWNSTDPARIGGAVGDFGSVSTGRRSVGVGPLPGGQDVSFELFADASDGLDFTSSEGSAKPQLTLTITSGGGGDTTAPVVTSRTPGSGAADVGVGSDVTATFSEAVTGVSGTTFRLRQGSTSVPASVTYASGTATLDPGADLAPGTTYTAELTSGITDAAGNPLAPVTWSFTTAGTTPTTRTVTLTASADTMVSENAPSTSYGGATSLQSDSRDVSTDSTSRITSYLKYAVPALAAGESISEAVLSINVTNGTSDGPTVHRTEATWTEALTWSGADPVRVGAPVGSFGSLATGRRSLAVGSVPAGGDVSFELFADTTNGLDFTSREGTAAPQLIVTITSGG